MLNDVNFSEEIEKIAAVLFRNIVTDWDLLGIKFEFYSENGDFHIVTHAEYKKQTISVYLQSLDIDELYEYFSAIRKKCIEKWYIAELKFYPDKTWDIEFVYGEIPEVEDDACEDDWQKSSGT